MAFLQLSNIGKIYTSENNVSIGIRQVNLSFEKGEFVAITGKSGSGKTTLLNVIGGLDSYEEGELYVEGKPTSHYIKDEWAEYNSKYISFIFQDYNILESFTVLQNVEFALTSITDIKERRQKALEIIKRVGLEHRLKSRGSNLSGGEKQRTVIARAIAKDSPVILADEPTGNLDSKNSKDILRLLKEISQDKLVIVVTHNYDDIKEYSTRHIRVFDGHIEADEKIVEVQETVYQSNNDNFEKERLFVFKKAQKKSKKSKEQRKSILRDSALLGFARFTSRPKQGILISSILFIVLLGLMLVVSGVNKFSLVGSSSMDKVSVNNIDGRVIVAGTEDGYTREQAEQMVKKYGANDYMFYDYRIDQDIVVESFNNQSMFSDNIGQIKLVDNQKMSEGRLPKNLGEVALSIPYNYKNKFKLGDYFSLGIEQYSESYGIKSKIVGLKYYIDNRIPMEVIVTKENFEYYAAADKIDHTISIDAITKPGVSDSSNINLRYYNFYILVDFELQGKVAKTNVVLPSNFDCFELYFDGEIIDKLNVETDSSKSYDYITTVPLWVSKEMYDKYINIVDTSRQFSLLFSDNDKAKEGMQKLKDDGYLVLLASETIEYKESKNAVEIILLFLQSYLISTLVCVAFAFIAVLTLVKLVMATKNDVSIFRTMGINNDIIKKSTYIHLICTLIPAVLLSSLIILIIYLAPTGVILIPFMGWDAALIIFLSIVLTVLIVAFSFNKLLYRQKIKKGLRRVNK